MIITEKDVQEISDYFYNHGNLPGDMQPKILSGLKELLALRSQKTRLIEDGERLAKYLNLCASLVGLDEDEQKAVEQHHALMKDLE